ncbi:MAG: type II secretion system F family protein [Propionibacteriaceae bacterium]
MELLAAAVGLFLSAGVLLLISGLRRVDRRPSSSDRGRLTRRWQRWRGRLAVTDRRRVVVLLVCLSAGVVLAVMTGWVVAILILPALGVALPALLSVPRPRDVALLEGLDRWVRTLAAALPTGRSVPDAIRVSRRTAPPVISAEVATLVSRLDARWQTEDALRAFADVLDSPDADAVVAALILAARRGTSGASLTLSGLADNLQAHLHGRRTVETERAKPYQIVRQVSVITLGTLGFFAIISRDFFTPYATPLGQLILAGLVVAYLGSLVLMRHRARPPERRRLLVREAA